MIDFEVDSSDILAAYDDMAVENTYNGADHEYTYPTTTYGSTPRLGPRRASSMSFSRQYSNSARRGSYYETPSSTAIKFKARGSVGWGITLADAASGVKLSGGDYVKWHEINADSRNRILLKISVSHIVL